MIAPSRKVEADDSAAPAVLVKPDAPQIDEVPAQSDYKELFRSEAFMNEPVLIMLHPTADPSETGVPVSVNGDRVYLIPGVPMKVKRKHVAQLLKARPDYVTHRSDDPSTPERHLNRMIRQSTSAYNFDVIEDTVQGAAWVRELRSKYIRR